MLRLALPVPLALACLWPSLALADRESDFEDGLRQRGYYELLETYYQDKLAGPGLSARDKADLASNLSSLYMSIAETKSDLADKERFWQKASAILRQHLPEGSKDAIALRTRIRQGAMELDKARVLSGAQAPEPDANPKSEAAVAFEAAISTFKSVRDDAYGVLQTQGITEKESGLAEAVAVEAEYRLAWSRYYFALAHGAKVPARLELLRAALQAFQVIGSSYYDIEAGYDCILGAGLCHRELGANAQALKSLDEALDKAKTPRIRLNAYYNKAVTLYNMGRHDDAIKAAETARKIRLSEPSALEVVHAAHLLQARAYYAMSEFKRGEEQKRLVNKAVETAKELTDVGGKWSAAAFDLIASWGGQEQRGDSFGHFAKAESLFRQGKYEEAVPALQDFLKLPADPRHAALIPEATFRLAVCHYQLKQYQHAAEGFSKVVREHRQTPCGARSAYWASLAAERRYAETKSKDDQRRYMQSLRFLMDTYPNTKEAADAQILVASLLQEQGEFAAAAREYEKIAKGSESYQDALYGAGLCYQKLLYKAWESSSATAAGDVSKLLANTIEKFRLAGLSSPGSAEGDERIARGKKLAAASDLALATLYLNDNVGKPQEALTILKAYHHKYPDDREGVAQAAFLELWAYGKLGDLDGAKKKLQALPKEYADHEQWPSAMKALGLDLDAEARRRLQKGNKEGSNELKREAMAIYEHFIRWAMGRAGMENDVTQFQLRLAECYVQLEDWTSGVTLYQELLKRYPAAINLREGLAACYEGSARYDDALKVWRMIEEGTRAGSDPWWNAKYHIVLMHKQLGHKSNALEIIRVTRLLRPTMGGPDLKKKFEDIEKACQ